MTDADMLAEIDVEGAEKRAEFVLAHYASDMCWRSCKTIVSVDVPALIARVRALEAQAAIGRLAQEYVDAVCAEHETETLGLDQEAFEAEWDRRWDVADAAYVRLREAASDWRRSWPACGRWEETGR